MERKEIKPDIALFPAEFQPLLKSANLFDSSCSDTAEVIFIDKDAGYYLKSAEKGSLAKEAEMTRFFHEKSLGAEVLSYISNEKDWMLTAKVPGEDCTTRKYLENPARLCDLLAQKLRELHSFDIAGCPISDQTTAYYAIAEQNYKKGSYDKSAAERYGVCASAEEAWKIVQSNKHLLKTDTLLHGDYCLPNVMLDDWKFSAFIDVGNGGVGDRHIDIFWGIWSLGYNLKTDRYRDRFLDAYGRDAIDIEMLPVIAAFEVFGG